MEVGLSRSKKTHISQDAKGSDSCSLAFWLRLLTKKELIWLFGRHVCCLKLPETSEEFIEALKDKDDDELLILLGRHAVEEHKECDNVKHKFADYVHKSGRYLLRSQKLIQVSALQISANQ